MQKKCYFWEWLLIVGSLMIVALLFFIQPETAIATTMDTTTTGSYVSDKFRAEAKYWLEIDISSNASSTIHIIGQTTGEVFKVDGTTYKYTVQIQTGDVYQVQVENKANWYDWWDIFHTSPHYVNNHMYGDFYLKRTPTYFFQVMPLGVALLTVGLLMIPSVIYVEYRARQKAKSLYECPRCKREVSIGLEVCPYCKLDLTKYWVRCKYCNKFYDSHLEKCPKCGAETEV